MDQAKGNPLLGRLPRGGVDRNAIASCPITRTATSPPSRGRGSKQVCRSGLGRCRHVASLAGAWIETGWVTLTVDQVEVASLAGAWIETCRGRSKFLRTASRLPRGGVDRNRHSRAPKPYRSGSPPSRGRGSKHLHAGHQRLGDLVASLAGAWIETLVSSSPRQCISRRLPRGGVDRNPHRPWRRRRSGCRLPRGGVDRNPSSGARSASARRRLTRSAA